MKKAIFATVNGRSYDECRSILQWALKRYITVKLLKINPS
jgi:hypothetical protein